MKNTKAKRTIELYGGTFGVGYDKKTYKNIEKILKCHKEYMKNRDMFDFGVTGKDSIEKIAPFVYRNFIGKKEIGQAVVNRMVMQILNDEKTEDILYDTLEDIKKFRLVDQPDDEEPLGQLYYKILREMYFTDACPTNTEVYTKLDLDSHVYSYRKQEAVMLFGIYFWQKCLGFWKDWRENQTLIQKEEGRTDLYLGYSCG